MSRRRHFTGEEIVRILKRHCLEQVPVSNLCEEDKIHPTLFYRWQKKFFEDGATLFERGANGNGEARRMQERVEVLEQKLQRKDGLRRPKCLRPA